MNWYYAVARERKGPLNEEEFQRLVQQGIITSQTLVWREGMANWQPFGVSTPPPIGGVATAGQVICAGCHGTFPNNEVIAIGHGSYCAACKPLALQRLKEGVSSNTAADEIRKAHIKHEASVQSVGSLYYLGGAVLTVLGIVSVLSDGSLFETSRPVAVLTGVFLLGFGTVEFWVGTGLRRLRKWARIPTGILSGIGLLGFPVVTLISAYILYLIFSEKGRMVFSDEYRVVIEQTPHIKYRTSIVVWILLGILFLLIALIVLAGLFAARRR